HGRIVGVLDFDDVHAGCPVDDAGDAAVLPGVVDTNVRVTEDTTRAAARGGVTTLLDMPFDGVDATTTATALDVRRRAMTRRCAVDVGLWGAVVPGNERELSALFEAGVFGFVCALLPTAGIQ